MESFPQHQHAHQRRHTMKTPSYDPRTDAIDAWSCEFNFFQRHPSDPSYPSSLYPNTIQIPDPPIFNPNPKYSRYPTPYIGVRYAVWEEEMKEKLKAYSEARFEIRMAYVMSRLGEKPRAYLQVRMSIHERFGFRNTDEVFEVLGKVYGEVCGGMTERVNADLASENDEGVVSWKEWC